ncbi:mCpol domain-containing protein [Streptomyces alkaliphilus]|uniref:MCpol domain-containing protein n=2 Tax=Streptomyces alkaliphilus TaxID=1472722 RepID=A0A7W3TB84_9ACTN|nr:mCpol domain-containing protein [Streptomyces alkaliphilus]
MPGMNCEGSICQAGGGVFNMSKKWFLALDGDDIGRRLEFYMVSEDTAGLESFSNAFGEVVESLKFVVSESPSVDVILQGGDSFLLSAPLEDLTRIISGVKGVVAETSFTFSGGYGPSMKEAYLALKIAKSSGKNRFNRFEGLGWDK